MKKVFALILSALLALCIFSGCGEKKKKIDDIDAVQALVCEYVDLLCCGEVGALYYVMENSENYAETQQVIEMIASFKTFAQDNGASEEYTEGVNLQIKKFYDKINKMITCDVTSTAVDKDKASVVVNITAPDFENAENIVNKLIDEGKIEKMLTEEEKAEYDESGFSIRYSELVFEEALKELQNTASETPISFELQKINSDWKIVKIDGGLFKGDISQ